MGSEGEEGKDAVSLFNGGINGPLRLTKLPKTTLSAFT